MKKGTRPKLNTYCEISCSKTQQTISYDTEIRYLKGALFVMKICVSFLIYFTGISCLAAQDAETRKYLYMVDQRDQQTYRIIQIGDQVWMADNLNYYTDNSFCYLEDTNLCRYYGRLYKLKAALSACPEGWHLPGDDEWKKLEMEMGMKEKVANKTDYRGTRPGQAGMLVEGGSSGLEIKYSGALTFYHDVIQDKYRLEYMYNNRKGFYWTSTTHQQYKSKAWARFFKMDIQSINRNVYHESCAFSVRCVKD